MVLWKLAGFGGSREILGDTIRCPATGQPTFGYTSLRALTQYRAWGTGAPYP